MNIYAIKIATWCVFILILKLGEGKMAPTSNQVSYLPYDDYAQSANTLFHYIENELGLLISPSLLSELSREEQ